MIAIKLSASSIRINHLIFDGTLSDFISSDFHIKKEITAPGINLTNDVIRFKSFWELFPQVSKNKGGSARTTNTPIPQLIPLNTRKQRSQPPYPRPGSLLSNSLVVCIEFPIMPVVMGANGAHCSWRPVDHLLAFLSFFLRFLINFIFRIFVDFHSY